MPAFDPKAPKCLRKTQEWFGSIISRPLVEDSLVNPITPSGGSIVKEAEEFIAKSPTLNPSERIQIYNQQYWWRLINILQESFPLVLRLFGYDDFNLTLCIPYLQKYPPNHWSLSNLGDRLSRFIEEEYHGEDKALVLDAATLDEAFHSLFFRPLLKPLTLDNSEELENTLYLQPHVRLFAYPYDLFTFRKEMLKKKPEHWVENPFPELKKEQIFTRLFRLPTGETAWKTITEGEYLLLEQFKNGAKIDDVCAFIEKQPSHIVKEAEQSLKSWFADWGRTGLLHISKF